MDTKLTVEKKSGLNFIESTTDGKTGRKTWLFKCELKKST